MAEYQSNWEASEPEHVDFLLKESSDHLKINPAQERASIIENPSEYSIEFGRKALIIQVNKHT